MALLLEDASGIDSPRDLVKSLTFAIALSAHRSLELTMNAMIRGDNC
jgi:hypothetical protein